MTIVAYSDEAFTTQVPSTEDIPNPFTVWINPSSYTYNAQVLYNDRQGQGSPGTSPDFNRVAAQDMAFDLVFDATGAIPPPTGQTPYTNGVADVIRQFAALTVTVNGKQHRPNYLKLSWAQLQFQCVLSSMKVNYTLFRPDGTPLRAKVSVNFKAFSSELQLAKKANNQSPDMTHIIQVQAGDTLPWLCFQIYGSSGYYLKVSKFNGLSSFRAIPPGTQLVFPPLNGLPQ